MYDTSFKICIQGDVTKVSLVLKFSQLLQKYFAFIIKNRYFSTF